MRSRAGAVRTILLFHIVSIGPLNSLFFSLSRGLGWRMHLGVEVTELSTNKQHHLSHTLNLALYNVDSKIESEAWSHYCSTRPLEPREVADRVERVPDRMIENPFALVNPIVAQNLTGISGAGQQGSTATTPAADGAQGRDGNQVAGWNIEDRPSCCTRRKQ